MFPSTARDLGIFLRLVPSVIWKNLSEKKSFMMIYDGNDNDNDKGADEDEEENVIMKIMFVLY